MADNKVEWKETCNRYVAFLDIMGFKNTLKTQGHKVVKNLLESIYPSINNINKFAENALTAKSTKGNPFGGTSIIKPTLFSDSIVFISNDGSADSAYSMIFTISWILSRAFDKGIPMKGAVAYGKMTAELEKSFYFGQPLIDAFELHNELYMYGVILHDSMEKRLKEFSSINPSAGGFLLKWSVPLKTGKNESYIVNWTNYYFLFGLSTPDPIKLTEKFYDGLSGNKLKYVDNTMEFIRWISKQIARLEKTGKTGWSLGFDT